MTENFHTTDVDLAAFLKSRGHAYLRLEPNPTDPTLADFVFEPSEGILEGLREWGDPSVGCMVDARDYGRLRRKMFRTAARFGKGARR